MKAAVLLAVVCAAVCVLGHGDREHLNPSGYLYKDYSLQKPYLGVYARVRPHVWCHRIHQHVHTCRVGPAHERVGLCRAHSHQR
jgi:hypothetical protein